MTKGKEEKDKQYNGKKKTTKDRKYNGQRKTLVIILLVLLSFSFDHYIVCPFLVFPLAIIMFVLLSFSFGHYTVYPFLVFL
jgi:hypothetical protein